MLYGRPFVYVNDLFLDPEAQTLQSYTTAIGQFQQDICLWGVGNVPDPGIKPTSPALQVDSLPLGPLGSPKITDRNNTQSAMSRHCDWHKISISYYL